MYFSIKLKAMRFSILLSVITFLAFSSHNVLAQYEHDSLQIETGYLHYYTKGKGDPIVLLQGGPGFSSYYMRAVADSLTNNKCILIDYEGTGRSVYRTPDSTWVSPEKVASDIERIRQKLGIEKWTILGHSYGTHFGLTYAIQYPKATKKLILLSFIGTNNLFQKYLGDNILARLSENDFEGLNKIEGDLEMSPADREYAIQSIILKSYFFDRNQVQPFLKAVPEEESTFFFNNAFSYAYWTQKNYWEWDISKECEALNLPIDIIQGRQDVVNDGTQELFNIRYKKSKIHYIEQSGHFPWIEQPNQVYPLIQELLK
jgi:proline iminopeptidase